MAHRERQKGVRALALKGIAWTSAAKVMQLTLQAVVLILLARLLSPAEFGLVALALIVSGLTETFGEAGLGLALVQRQDLHQRHINAAFTYSLLLGGVLTLAVVLAAPAVAGFFKEPRLLPVLWAMSVVLLLQGPTTVASSLLQRDLRFRPQALIDLCAYAVGFVGIGIGTAMLGWGVWALVAAHLTTAGGRAAAMLLIQRSRLGLSLDTRPLFDLLAYGGGITAARLINYFGRQGDNIVVGRLLGAVELGIYSRAYQLMALPANLFGFAVNSVVFSAYARIKEDAERLSRAYQRGLVMTALVFIPLSALAAITAREVVATLLGAKWTAVEAPFAILVAGMFFRGAYKVSGSISLALGAVNKNAALQGVYALIVVVGGVFGSRWGSSGVAWAVLAAVVLHYLLLSRLALRLTTLSVRGFVAAHLPGIWLAGFVTVAVLPLVIYLRGLETPSLVVVVLAAAAAGVVTIAFCLLAPVLLGPDGRWWVAIAREWLARRGKGPPPL